MGLSRDKSEVIKKIKLYISLANSEIDNVSFDNLIANTNDPIDFLFDLVKSTIGENIMESLVQNALSSILKQETLDKFSDSIYNSISENLSENTSLPQSIINDGIILPIKSFDVGDNFRKVNIQGSSASKMTTNPFFQKMVNNVLSTPNVNVNISNSIASPIIMNYNEANSNIKVELPNLNQKEIFNTLKDVIGPLFSSQVVVAEIMNILFHTNFSKDDAQLLTLVRSYTKYENKDVFKLDLKKLLDLELETEAKGLNVDTNCFKENIEITIQQIEAIISNPTVESFNTLIPEFNTNTSTTNFKNDYHKSIVKTIIEALLMIVIKQPGVMFIINIFNKLMNINDDFLISIGEIFNKIKVLIEKIFDNVYEIFFCTIFNFIKNYIIKLVITIVIILLKEQLQKRSEILLSLSGVGSVARNFL
jgi:hypothetical protein